MSSCRLGTDPRSFSSFLRGSPKSGHKTSWCSNSSCTYIGHRGTQWDCSCGCGVSCLIQILVRVRNLDRDLDLGLVFSDLVRVEQLADRDVNDRFVDDEQLRVFVHTEPVLWFGNVTHRRQELPVRQEEPWGDLTLIQTLYHFQNYSFILIIIYRVNY